MICPNCGSDQFRKRGIEHYASGDYQRWQCKKCGKHTIAGKIEEKQTI
jgi:transposase-like protein